jgi:ectoine hydroxylase-related dioxygenase (phytanoyl-CoA dioxygenase family)
MPATIPQSPAASDRAAVAAFYQEHGFYIGRNLVDPGRLAGLEKDFDRMVEQILATSPNANARWNQETTTALDNDRSSVVIHTHQVQKYSAAWARWLFDDRYLDVVEALIGPDIVMHHTKLFLKPAGRGAAFPPHQDYGYFRTVTHSMMAAVVYLSGSDEGNGCLRVWPGSHKQGPIDPKESMGGSAGFSARFPIDDSIPAEARPGDVVFFNYLTVHGSLPNRGDRPRKSVLVQLHSGADRMEDAKGHPNTNLVLRGWNHHMTRERADAG